MTYNTKLWQEIIDLGNKNEPRTKGITNKLKEDEIITIIGTMEFFNATEIWMKQTMYDLRGPPKYRVFDWMAMNIMGRNDDNREVNNTALKVLVNAYLKANGNVSGFIENLRVEDYQVNTEWEKIQIEV